MSGETRRGICAAPHIHREKYTDGRRGAVDRSWGWEGGGWWYEEGLDG